MNNKVVHWNNPTKGTWVFLFSFIHPFWYGISLIITANLLSSVTEESMVLSLLSNRFLTILSLARSLMDVQYLVKIGFHEILTTFLMIVRGFTWIELSYLVFLLLMTGWYVFKTHHSKTVRFILDTHAVFIAFAIAFASYLSYLAFSVFYQVNIDFFTALSSAATAMLIFGIFLLIYSCLFTYLVIRKDRKMTKDQWN